MDVTSISQTSGKMDAGNVNAIASDFETFLRMLTTQIQNQDPLSPMEADKFASQLASFSMVEQQTLTNHKLEAVLHGLSAGGLGGYSGLVGREAVHEGAVRFSGSALEFEIEGRGGVPENAILAVLDDEGGPVAKLALGAGQERVTWDGTAPDGRSVLPGFYQAELRRRSDGEALEIPVATSAVIEEVRFSGDEVELLLADGSVIPESGVSKLR